MAITVFGVGASAESQTAITPPLPTGTLLTDDLLCTIGESVGGESYFAGGAPPAGWAHFLGSPLNLDTTTRLTAIWKRFVPGDTAPSWGDSGNHNVGRMIAFRGVKTTGNPWNAIASTTEPDLVDNTFEFPTVLTTVNDCMIVLAIATGRDFATTANFGTPANAALTSITERMDNWIALGTGGGIGMATGLKAAAGAVGQSTGTLGSSDGKALMTIALEPAGGAAPATRPPGRREPRGRAARLRPAIYAR